MSSTFSGLAALLLSGSLLVSSPLQAATPQNNLDSGLFLVNRTWTISSGYTPELTEAHVIGQLRRMTPEATAALEAMFAAAQQETGLTLTSISGFRGYTKQSVIYKRKLKNVRGDQAKADDYVARPGTSEHQMGLAMDVGVKGSKTALTAKFGETQAGRWLKENCHRFGFIIRYPLGKEDITGYQYEPWHVRYVGLAHAQKIHEQDVPMEIYLLGVREQTLLNILQKTEE